MNYLHELTDNDVRYICSVIPLKDLKYYFQMNPREFVKIKHGFRPKSIKNQKESCELLFRYRNNNFISSFIEDHISKWLCQIKENIEKMIKEGNSRELALLKTLPLSFFMGNVGLFFKLINEEYSEEYIALFSAAVTLREEASVQEDKLHKESKVKESEIKKIQAELNAVTLDLKKTEEKLNVRNAEIKELKHSISNIENLKSSMHNDEVKIGALKDRVQVLEDNINCLRNELKEEKNRNQQHEAQIKSELEKLHVAKALEQQVSLKPKCPRDIKEFKEFLGYNLEYIGIPTKSEYYSLLKEHLSKILFQGMPIIVSHNVARNLMKCIANTLIGRSYVKTLAFSKNLLIDDINLFLSSAERVVCLDNFIGNYNETELLTLFDNHRNKIIFLTVAYDRTIHYVSKEFLLYCHYLNLNRIPALSANVELEEDPSTLEEEDIDFKPQRISCENRFVSLFKEILGEFGFPRSLIERKCTAIYEELDLCCMLAFDVLPCCVDVLQISPYNTSARMVRYLESPRMRQYKNLFEMWFKK